MSVQLIALLANCGLALLKFTVGNLAGSRALLADGFNSAGDVLATFVAWIAFRYGRTPPDADHPYGHGNAEALAGLLLGGVLSGTGAFIAIDGVEAWLASERFVERPDRAALWAAAVTIAVKAVLLGASLRVGRRTNSPTLLASARDHRADVVTGSVALVAIFLGRAGYPEFDVLGGILIGGYVFWLGIEPVRSNVNILMQRAPVEMAERARALAADVDTVRGVGEVRVQPVGGLYRMDLILLVDGERSVADAHELAHAVEDAIRAGMQHVTEVYVHVEPARGA